MIKKRKNISSVGVQKIVHRTVVQGVFPAVLG